MSKFKGIYPHRLGIGSGHLSEYEPSLNEVLVDPIVHMVMKCDGIQMADLQRFLGDMKRRIQ